MGEKAMDPQSQPCDNPRQSHKLGYSKSKKGQLHTGEQEFG